MAQAKPALYHAPQTRSATTFWMNEEVGAPCEIRLIDIKKGAQKEPDYLNLNPMGKIPMLVHGGVVVTEVAAICAYLADAYPRSDMAPKTDDPQRGAYYRWMFYAPSVIEPAMLDIFSGDKRENPQTVGHGAVPDVMATINKALENGPFLLGDKFTAADVVFGATLNFGMMFGAFPKEKAFTEYVDRLTARPAAKRAAEKDTALMKELGWE